MGMRGAAVADTVAADDVPLETVPPAATGRAGVLAVAHLSGVHGGVPASLLALAGLRSIRRGSPVAGLGLIAVGAVLAHRKAPAPSEPVPTKPAKA